MSDIVSSARNLRKALTKHNYIDHTVELQLIAAVLIENQIYYQNQLNIAAKFAKYFNKKWNLQIISRKQNEIKKQLVLEYIKWKYETTFAHPRNNVLDKISQIFDHYCHFRSIVIEDINNNEIVHREKFIQIEKSLFSLLHIRNRKHPFIQYYDIIEESNELYYWMAKYYSLDHVVELQIISTALVSYNIRDINLAAKFANYFNEQWNFQILTKSENVNKGQNVTEWLKWLHNDRNIKLNQSIVNCVKAILNRYRDNRHILNNIIQNDHLLIPKETDIFYKIEGRLYDMLSNEL